jgi:AcrR family transcriptional regulator
MSPRPYRAGQRQTASDATRARIVAAARDLLSAPDQPADFTVEAVARKAGLSRMTVYYQFGSRAALLEAILDDLAMRGGMHDLPAAMQQESPAEALAAVVAIFCRFWEAERLIVRRLRAMAVLDPELTGVFRDERRRQLLEVIAQRSPEAAGWSASALRTKVDLLQMLTSFASYDSVAEDQGEDAVPALQRLARLALLVDEA